MTPWERNSFFFRLQGQRPGHIVAWVGIDEVDEGPGNRRRERDSPNGDGTGYVGRAVKKYWRGTRPFGIRG